MLELQKHYLVHSVGVNDAPIEHPPTGNTNYVTIVRDDITTFQH